MTGFRQISLRFSTQYDGMPGLPGILPTIANCLTFKMPRRGGRGPPYLQNMNKCSFKLYFCDIFLWYISLIFVLWLVVDDQHRRLEESSSCWRTAFSRPKASNYAIGPLLLKLFPLQRLYISCFCSFSLYRCPFSHELKNLHHVTLFVCAEFEYVEIALQDGSCWHWDAHSKWMADISFIV